MRLLLFNLAATVVCLIVSCSDEAPFRSDKPLTRVTALKELPDFPLSGSAHSIYYLMFAGGLQDLEQYVRFDVDPDELDSSVDALVAWNNKVMSRSLSYPRESLSTADVPGPRKEFLPMLWWDPSAITAGYYRGHIDGYALRILVDQTHSRVYVYQND